MSQKTIGIIVKVKDEIQKPFSLKAMMSAHYRQCAAVRITIYVILCATTLQEISRI